MIKKILCLILTLLMTISVFAGCVENPDKDDENKDATAGDTAAGVTEPAETVNEAREAFEATEVNFGGAKFNISCVENVGNSTAELKDDGESSEALEQAVFTRNITLAEKCNLVYTVIPTQDVATAVRAANKSGAGDIHVAFPNMQAAASLATSNQLIDFNTIGDVKLDKEWWDQGTRELIIGDHVFFMNSSINYFSYDVTYMMLFSKTLATDLGVGSPYNLVYDHEWTLDKFSTLIADVAKDNGDSDRTNDRYGFITTNMYGNTFFYGSGLKYVKCEEGEDPTLMLDETKLEKVDKLLDKLFVIYYNNGSTFECGQGGENVGMNMFSQNQSLFYGEVASYIVNLRNMSDDFGVIPVPLYDENQENYYTWTNAIGSTMVIPKGLTDDMVEQVGQVIEAMTELSHYTVRPAYYDIVLKSKGARDEESGPMLDIVFAHRVYDLASYYDLGVAGIFQECVSKHTKTFTSSYQKVSKSFDSKVRRLIKNIK